MVINEGITPHAIMLGTDPATEDSMPTPPQSCGWMTYWRKVVMILMMTTPIVSYRQGMGTIFSALSNVTVANSSTSRVDNLASSLKMRCY
jgi:hypothetical protein